MSDISSDPLIGKVIDGFRILSVLGEGGMGIVYEAEDEELARTVALKMIFPSLARDETFVRRFRSEARALARIKSRYIVGVHALRKTDLGFFIVMECVNGGTVKDLMAGGGIPWERAQPIIDQMLIAFGEAHEVGVIHRDIKPANVMLTTTGQVKVTDFGLAKLFTGEGAAMATVTQGIAGTLFYMSPEQVRGRSDLDHRSDLYSVGMTIYQMLVGRLPIERDSSEFEIMQNIVEITPPPPSSFNPNIPPELDAILMKSLAKDPADRYQSAEEMRQAFLSFHRSEHHATLPDTIAGGDGYAPPPKTKIRPKKTTDSSGGISKALLFGGVGILFAILVAVGYFLSRPDGEQLPPPVEVGTLVVSANPRDAALFVNGEAATPGTSIEVPAGNVDIRVEKAGYDPHITTERVGAGEVVPLNIELFAITDEIMPPDDSTTGNQTNNGTPSNGSNSTDPPPDRNPPDDTTVEPARTASITLIAPRGGSVQADGTTRNGDSQFTLPEGRQSITFTHPTYGSWTTSVNVRVGRSEQYQAYFERTYTVAGRVDGEVLMSAPLFIDGRDSGKYGPQVITLGRGAHRLEVRKAGYTNGAKTVDVQPSLGEPSTERVFIEMLKQ